MDLADQRLFCNFTAKIKNLYVKNKEIPTTRTGLSIKF